MSKQLEQSPCEKAAATLWNLPFTLSIDGEVDAKFKCELVGYSQATHCFTGHVRNAAILVEFHASHINRVVVMNSGDNYIFLDGRFNDENQA